VIIGLTKMGKSRDLFRKYKTTLGFDNVTHLITEDVYSKTRNPMYLGMFLLLLGIGICFMNLFSLLSAFLFLLVIYFSFLPKEEKMLLDRFGQKYIDYKRTVRRWI
jgi:protein-S-isoprenylcysteine O-methyltransferase Ste14